MNFTTKILTITFLFFSLCAATEIAAQGTGFAVGVQIPQTVPQTQVQPMVQPPVTNPGFSPNPSTPLGVMTHFIPLQRPVQISGASGQPSFQQQPSVAVSPPVSSGRTAYYGFYIANVTPGSVAQRAGLEVGDIVLSLNNQPMRDQYSLRSAIMYSQNRTVSAVVLNVRTGMPTVVYCSFSQPFQGSPRPHSHYDHFQKRPANPQFQQAASLQSNSFPATQSQAQSQPQSFNANR